jgi:hypothetical protein
MATKHIITFEDGLDALIKDLEAEQKALKAENKALKKALTAEHKALKPKPKKESDMILASDLFTRKHSQ